MAGLIVAGSALVIGFAIGFIAGFSGGKAQALERAHVDGDDDA
jgi:ABC-type dipeptide/oligopeptide/nickel transport system permease subunit